MSFFPAVHGGSLPINEQRGLLLTFLSCGMSEEGVYDLLVLKGGKEHARKAIVREWINIQVTKAKDQENLTIYSDFYWYPARVYLYLSKTLLLNASTIQRLRTLSREEQATVNADVNAININKNLSRPIFLDEDRIFTGGTLLSDGRTRLPPPGKEVIPAGEGGRFWPAIPTQRPLPDGANSRYFDEYLVPESSSRGQFSDGKSSGRKG